MLFTFDLASYDLPIWSPNRFKTYVEVRLLKKGLKQRVFHDFRTSKPKTFVKYLRFSGEYFFNLAND